MSNKEMKEWKIIVSGKAESADGTEETAREIVRQARIAGLKVAEVQVSFGNSTSSLGVDVDDPGLSREAALGAANHPDPLADTQGRSPAARPRNAGESDADERDEAQRGTSRLVGDAREDGERVTRSGSALHGDTTKR